jgi:hypothetical protein
MQYELGNFLVVIIAIRDGIDIALTKAVGLEREAAAMRLAEIRHTIGRLEAPSTLDDLRRDRGRDSA